MVNVTSFTNLPATPAVALPTPMSSAADKVSTRLTPVAVAAPMAGERVADNQAAPQPPVSLSQPGVSQPSPTTAGAVADSSSYLTQLYSQAADGTPDLFARFAPALQYNRLVGYSLVKYKPSDAGLPTSLSAHSPPSDLPAASGAEYEAYRVAQFRPSAGTDDVVARTKIAG